MSPKEKKTKGNDDQRTMTTWFSSGNIGAILTILFAIAIGTATFSTRLSVLEHSEQVTKAAIKEIKEEDQMILELGAEINYNLADIVAKEDRLILDVQKIEERLHRLEIRGGVRN